MLPCSSRSKDEDSGYLIPLALNAETSRDDNAGPSEANDLAHANYAFAAETETKAPLRSRLGDGADVATAWPKLLQLDAPAGLPASVARGDDANLEPARGSASAVLRKQDWPGSTRSVGCRGDARPHSAPAPGTVQRCARGSACWRHARVKLHYCCCCCCSGGAGRRVTVQAATKLWQASDRARSGNCQFGGGVIPLRSQHSKFQLLDRRDLPSLPLYLDVSVSEGIGEYDSLHHSPVDVATQPNRKRRNPLYWHRSRPQILLEARAGRKFAAFPDAPAGKPAWELKLAAASRRVVLWSLFVPSLVLVAALVAVVLLATKTAYKRGPPVSGEGLTEYEQSNTEAFRVRHVEEQMALLQGRIENITKMLEANTNLQLPPGKLGSLMSTACHLIGRAMATPEQAASTGERSIAEAHELLRYCVMATGRNTQDGPSTSGFAAGA